MIGYLGEWWMISSFSTCFSARVKCFSRTMLGLFLYFKMLAVESFQNNVFANFFLCRVWYLPACFWFQQWFGTSYYLSIHSYVTPNASSSLIPFLYPLLIGITVLTLSFYWSLSILGNGAALAHIQPLSFSSVQSLKRLMCFTFMDSFQTSSLSQRFKSRSSSLRTVEESRCSSRLGKLFSVCIMFDY